MGEGFCWEPSETPLSLRGGGALAVRPLRGLDVLHHVVDARDAEVGHAAVAGVHLDGLAAAVGRDLGHHAARATPRGLHRRERAEHDPVRDDGVDRDGQRGEPGGHLLGTLDLFRRLRELRVQVLTDAGGAAELHRGPHAVAALLLARDGLPLRRGQERALRGVQGRDGGVVEQQQAGVLLLDPGDLAEHLVLPLGALELGEVRGNLLLAALALVAGVVGGLGRVVGGGAHCRVFPFYASAMRYRSVTGLATHSLAPFRPCLSLLPLHSSTLGPLLQVS